jgi:hypothetical protein
MTQDKAFNATSKELANELQATAEAFLNKRGMKELSIPSLSQLTVSLNQVSSELLMFGADIWPEYACSSKMAA